MRKGSLIASGTLIAVAFAALLALGIFTVILYKTHEAGLPPESATFQRVTPPANATVHELAYSDVHSKYQDSFLEDHLNTAVQSGTSSETDRLRVEQMRATIRALAGVDDTTLLVGWEGQVVQVSFSGVA